MELRNREQISTFLSHLAQGRSLFWGAALPAGLPLGHRPVLQEDSRHWLRAAEGVLGQSRLGEIKSQPGFFSQRVLAVHHAHRREAKPLEPNLVTRLGHDIAATLGKEVASMMLCAEQRVWRR